MIRGIHHIAVHTANFDRLVKFYKDAFGFAPNAPEATLAPNEALDRIIGVKGATFRVVLLRAGTCFLEVFGYITPKGRDGAPLRPHDHGYTHFCVDVVDVVAECKRLEALGMTFANPEPVTYGDVRTVYGKDPDGNIIEVQEILQPCIYSIDPMLGGTPKQTRA